jgi:TetR/AcrR family transcriptional regulator
METAERRKIEKEQRVNSIIKAAEKLLSEKSYDSVSMEEIAKETGLATGTLYLYFDNKDELYFTVLSKYTGLFNEMTREAERKEKKGIDKVYAIEMALYQNFKSYPGFFRMLGNSNFTWSKDEEKVKRFFNVMSSNFSLLRQAIEAGKQDGTVKEDIDPLKSTVFIMMSLSSIVNIQEGLIENMKSSGMSHDDLILYVIDQLRDSLKAE